ncbi:unnamed protein product [Victoria cruziana]
MEKQRPQFGRERTLIGKRGGEPGEERPVDGKDITGHEIIEFLNGGSAADIRNSSTRKSCKKVKKKPSASPQFWILNEANP